MCVLVHIWGHTIKKVEHQRMDAFEMWCWRRLLRVRLDCKDIQPVNPKGNPPWIFIGRTDGEAETPILWLPDPKNWFIWKDPDSGQDWRREEKGTIEDEMVGWHHQLNGHEFGKLRELVMDSEAWRATVHPWGRKELDRTEQLNWTEPVLSSQSC